MKKISFISLLIVVLVQSPWAQRVNITSLDLRLKKIDYKFNLPGNGYPISLTEYARRISAPEPHISWTPSLKDTVLATYIEFGDGTYSLNDIGTHTYKSNSLFYPVLTKCSVIYDDGKRPPPLTLTADARVASVRGPEPPAEGVMDSTVLASGKYIKITPNIGSVVPGDTMIFVLTYKLNENLVSAAGKLAIRFHYNNGEHMFTVLNDPNSLVIRDQFSIANGVPSVPCVRRFNGETISDKPRSRAAEQDFRNKNGYWNMLEIKGLPVDNKEHNLFITLVPNQEFTKLTGYEGIALNPQKPIQLFAEMIPENSQGEVIKTSELTDKGVFDTLSLPAFAKSHDPNYVIISPDCLLFPKKGKLLNVYVHCENEGKGRARIVKMKINLPAGVSPYDIISSGTCSAKVPNGAIASWAVEDNRYLICTFKPKDSSGHVLDGYNKDKPYDPNTMTDAWFTITANEDMYNLILCTADIYFANMPHPNIRNDGPWWNAPVTTNPGMSRFSECCDCGNKKASRCKKIKSKFLRWLFCKKC
jgi:hypothetical protein